MGMVTWGEKMDFSMGTQEHPASRGTEQPRWPVSVIHRSPSRWSICTILNTQLKFQPWLSMLATDIARHCLTKHFIKFTTAKKNEQHGILMVILNTRNFEPKSKSKIMRVGCNLVTGLNFVIQYLSRKSLTGKCMQLLELVSQTPKQVQ